MAFMLWKDSTVKSMPALDGLLRALHQWTQLKASGWIINPAEQKGNVKIQYKKNKTQKTKNNNRKPTLLSNT